MLMMVLQIMIYLKIKVFGNWGIAGGATDDYYITKVIKFIRNC